MKKKQENKTPDFLEKLGAKTVQSVAEVEALMLEGWTGAQ